MGYRHGQDRDRRSGGGGLRVYPRSARQAVQRGHCRGCYHSVRRLYEREERRGACIQDQR